MARTKKSESTPVRVRFKELKGGNQSIYLETYLNGKRTYEYLGLFLLAGTSREAREKNEHTLKAVDAIRAQRILDITNKKTEVIVDEKAKMPFLDWLEEFKEASLKMGKSSIKSAVKNLSNYLRKFNAKVKLHEIDKDFIDGFLAYLDSVKTTKEVPLASNTINNLYGTLSSSLSMAVHMGILQNNPLASYKWISQYGRRKEAREYLTLDEVQRLIGTPCKREDVKRCFLFSCFCGLRISDVRALKWKDVVYEHDKVHLELTQKKTETSLYLPLSKQAQAYLPKKEDTPKGNPEDNVFSLCSLVTVAKTLTEWAKAAKITKRVTYHISRHTFATLTLTLGADIYTTSQLMGHSNVGVTQVYGKIIDRKKIEAAYLVDKLFDEED